MNQIDWLSKLLGWLPRPILARLEARARRIPAVQRGIEQEYESLLRELAPVLRPYQARFPVYRSLPAEGVDQAQVLATLAEMKELECAAWEEGFASGAVYHGEAGHLDFLNQVYALHSQSNPLHADIWPSAAKFEAEIVAMTASMLGSDKAEAEIVGTVTSGGTESILLAMKSYRDEARARRGIDRPEIVAPVTAHAAFDKAAQYFGLKLVSIPLTGEWRADVAAARRAINRHTVALVASAPAFPHGIMDPVAELANLAHERGIGCHVDACLGGFILPWAEQLGYPVPPFDFRLPGVTSMSADTHKYGYAPKGSSVVLYRGAERRHFQYYTASDWPGGLYFSPTLAGSRPGALSAACWAALVTMGAEGYRSATRRILETAATIKAGIQAMPALELLGDPLWVIAFAGRGLDIYRVMESMSERGWHLNGLHRPAALHLAVTLRHTQPGVAERFLADLAASVAEVEAQPEERGVMAPIYGLAATLPFRGLVRDLLLHYVDLLYDV